MNVTLNTAFLKPSTIEALSEDLNDVNYGTPEDFEAAAILYAYLQREYCANCARNLPPFSPEYCGSIHG